MNFASGDRVEITTGRSAESYYPPHRRGTVSANRPPESGYPAEREDAVWVEFDPPHYDLRAAWVHVEIVRKLSLLELIAEAANDA